MQIEAPVITEEETESTTEVVISEITRPIVFAHSHIWVSYKWAGNSDSYTTRLTLAWETVKGSNGQIYYRYGVAFCSPHDQFSRKLGRQIASGRLSKSDRLVEAVENVSPIQSILCHIHENSLQPTSWKAFQQI